MNIYFKINARSQAHELMSWNGGELMSWSASVSAALINYTQKLKICIEN